jgi:hypothetical protein
LQILKRNFNSYLPRNGARPLSITSVVDQASHRRPKA